MNFYAPRTQGQRMQANLPVRLLALATGVGLIISGITGASVGAVILGSIVIAPTAFMYGLSAWTLHREHRAQVETGWLDELPVTYGAIGDSVGPRLMSEPPRGYRATERRAVIGSGREAFERAATATLRWEVKTRSGFRVTRVGKQGALTSDEPVVKQECAIVRWGPIRETVRVVRVVDEPRRRGFAYGTLPEHPLRGEEAFLVEWRDDDSVEFVIRSFSRPSTLLWWALYPALLIAQQVFLARYERALRVF